MSEIRITKQAASDLDEICLSLYTHNNSFAVDQLMAGLLKKCRMHAETPEAGVGRLGLFPQLRGFSLSEYEILYRVSGNGIDVICVLKRQD